jgi:hypothetical protein
MAAAILDMATVADSETSDTLFDSTWNYGNSIINIFQSFPVRSILQEIHDIDQGPENPW